VYHEPWLRKLGVILKLKLMIENKKMMTPILEENKCSVLIAEYAAGIAYKTNLTLF
jgi:hypothetical protein